MTDLFKTVNGYILGYFSVNCVLSVLFYCILIGLICCYIGIFIRSALYLHQSLHHIVSNLLLQLIHISSQLIHSLILAIVRIIEISLRPLPTIHGRKQPLHPLIKIIKHSLIILHGNLFLRQLLQIIDESHDQIVVDSCLAVFEYYLGF